jgi:hypothetical protein
MNRLPTNDRCEYGHLTEVFSLQRIRGQYREISEVSRFQQAQPALCEAGVCRAVRVCA